MAGQKVNKQYAMYEAEGRLMKNKIRKLKRLINLQPANLPLVAALKRVEEGNMKVRKNPILRPWTPGKRSLAQLITKVGYNGRLALLETPHHEDDKKIKEAYGFEWKKAQDKAYKNKPGFFLKPKPTVAFIEKV